MALYGEHINAHRFELVSPLIAEDAVFWFGDGSHVGLEAIGRAFEATWQALADETYWLEDLHWIARGDLAAACVYRFCWTATVGGAPARGSGRGTSVLGRGPQGWQIVHEHLSPSPA
ncbi:MAG: nuclear transport factor 2 family protein [Alphaproteobacteria bacterium]|nr:nuclear transport factor 2 family protein [Alphaproteobacteria bacterium]